VLEDLYHNAKFGGAQTLHATGIKLKHELNNL